MRNTISLDVIDVPRPCPADWDAMHGDGRVRFCDHCQLNVYNLSAMTRDAAERLIAEKEGHLCARFYRRADGTVLTADCGGGWRFRAKRLGRLALAGCAALVGGLLAPLGFGGTDRPRELRGQVLVKGEVAAQAVQGDLVMPATQPATQTADLRPAMGVVAPATRPTPPR